MDTLVKWVGGFFIVAFMLLFWGFFFLDLLS